MADLHKRVERLLSQRENPLHSNTAAMANGDQEAIYANLMPSNFQLSCMAFDAAGKS